VEIGRADGGDSPAWHEHGVSAGCRADRSGEVVGNAGPDLTRVGLKREADWLRQFLKNPKAVNSRAKMLAFEGTDQELEAVVAYLASLY